MNYHIDDQEHRSTNYQDEKVAGGGICNAEITNVSDCFESSFLGRDGDSTPGYLSIAATKTATGMAVMIGERGS